ncbi:Hypothetical predicted protein [Podarcis lilfordi]|uniref:Uncharacterized protein n=1 Tax=Podarcis lilfordi TaxID=74358 RepID=A0AA35PAC3_9SAUR|nr:Hypothetical predicted protein [Podarcis lilfordi]
MCLADTRHLHSIQPACAEISREPVRRALGVPISPARTLLQAAGRGGRHFREQSFLLEPSPNLLVTPELEAGPPAAQVS